MKKVTVLVVGLLLSAISVSVMAQQQDVIEKPRTQYNDNWFVGLGPSVNLLMAEQDKYQSFQDRLQLGGELYVGKWFNQNFGMRLQGAYGSLKGWNQVKENGDQITHRYSQPNNAARRELPYGVNWREYEYYHGSSNNNSRYSLDIWWPEAATYNTETGRNVFKYQDKTGNDGFWQQFRYATATVDLMANITNLARGHYGNPNKVDLILFGGFGYVHAFANGTTTPNFDNIIAKGGVHLDVNFNKNWALFLEAQGALTSEEFDGYSGDAIGDAISNLTLGVQYSFSKKYEQSGNCLTREEIVFINNKINESRSGGAIAEEQLALLDRQQTILENQQIILENQQDALDKIAKCCEDKPAHTAPAPGYRAIAKAGEWKPEYVRFSINSYKIEPSERSKIDAIVEFMNANPDSKMLLVGYADKMTGNAKNNWPLSNKRVNAVAKELQSYGVNPNRLITDFKGDVEQPYGQNDLNRVVIVVERR
ncbi:MAG: OmpA family protein [Dysgonamonadaceae bacterium]|nr:OmpA family protein [Dysgonamonadaceae bacterium]